MLQSTQKLNKEASSTNLEPVTVTLPASLSISSLFSINQWKGFFSTVIRSSFSTQVLPPHNKITSPYRGMTWLLSASLISSLTTFPLDCYFQPQVLLLFSDSVSKSQLFQGLSTYSFSACDILLYPSIAPTLVWILPRLQSFVEKYLSQISLPCYLKQHLFLIIYFSPLYLLFCGFTHLSVNSKLHKSRCFIAISSASTTGLGTHWIKVFSKYFE